MSGVLELDSGPLSCGDRPAVWAPFVGVPCHGAIVPLVRAGER
jgi:hypothetical protein